VKNRIRLLREEEGLKQAELAQILGVRQNTLSTWETGRYEPDNEMLRRIADHFNVSVDFVLGKSPVKNIKIPQVSTIQAINILRAVEEMSPEQYEQTYEFASDLISGRTPCSAVGKSIPVLGDVAAGIPIEAITDIVDYEEIDAAMAATGEFFALRIKGASMEPRMKEGDVVIVRQQDTADTGDTVVVLVNGDGATVKKIKFGSDGITLLSSNPAYDPIFYSAAEVQQLPVRVIGRVVELRAKY